jgi:hypothetical protein
MPVGAEAGEAGSSPLRNILLAPTVWRPLPQPPDSHDRRSIPIIIGEHEK